MIRFFRYPDGHAWLPLQCLCFLVFLLAFGSVVLLSTCFNGLFRDELYRAGMARRIKG